MALQFCFHLMPVDAIEPWSGADGAKSLSWYSLTFGWFWIVVGEQELFRYSAEALAQCERCVPSAAFDLPYEDYQVARYWEDLLEMTTTILDPIPADLAARVADGASWEAWQERALAWDLQHDERAEEELFSRATLWWGKRTWDAWQLRYPPCVWLWRVEDLIHIRWDNRGIVMDNLPVWTAQHGEYTLPVAEFIAAVQDFDARFLAAMGARVKDAQTNWTRPEITLDRADLAKQQRERAQWLGYALDPWAVSTRQWWQWDEVGAAIATLDTALGTDVKVGAEL